jgi:hypothetical protein
MNQLNNIPKSMHVAVIGSYWTMLRELESQADNESDPVLKHMVAGYYRQWNEMCEDNKEPIWETRKTKEVS